MLSLPCFTLPTFTIGTKVGLSISTSRSSGLVLLFCACNVMCRKNSSAVVAITLNIGRKSTMYFRKSKDNSFKIYEIGPTLYDIMVTI